MTESRPILSLKRTSSVVAPSDPPRVGGKQIITAVPGRKKKKPVVSSSSSLPQTDAPAVIPAAARKRPSRTVTLDQAKALLEQWWPMLLEDRNPRLMKQGIRADFHQDIACRQLSVSHKHLHRCLKAITRSEPYLYQMTNGAPRYDLLGNPFGIVTAEEHQYAREQLASLT
ncbi:ProQ/FINO family protein (plasmid) [Serratia fonticola]|uniref:ProQ/FINO family protein n=1 Tax=Serratia fonticola TaxID=47917 RepID=UPI003AF3319D